MALNRYFNHPGERATFEREIPDDEILLSRDERYEYLRQPYQKG